MDITRENLRTFIGVRAAEFLYHFDLSKEHRDYHHDHEAYIRAQHIKKPTLYWDWNWVPALLPWAWLFHRKLYFEGLALIGVTSVAAWASWAGNVSDFPLLFYLYGLQFFLFGFFAKGIYLNRAIARAARITKSVENEEDKIARLEAAGGVDSFAGIAMGCFQIISTAIYSIYS